MSLDRNTPPNPYEFLPAVDAFDVRSNDLVDGAPLDPRHSADGGNLSPHLVWSEPPPGTKSFVVTCFDPDAPIVSGFWHWTVVDIPGHVRELATGAGSSDASLPSAAFHIRHDGGGLSYYGAAPPPGDFPHRYFFVVHAIKDEHLEVDANTTPAVVGFKLAFATLGRAIMHSTFQR